MNENVEFLFIHHLSGSSAAPTTTTTTASSSTCPSGEADASQCAGEGVADASGLGPYGPDLVNYAQGESISANSNCRTAARGYFEEYVSGDYRYILISGAPNHVAECGQALPNPNSRCKLHYSIMFVGEHA